MLKVVKSPIKNLVYKGSYFNISSVEVLQDFSIIFQLLNPFVPNAPFLYYLKQKVFRCFQGIDECCIGNEWVK